MMIITARKYEKTKRIETTGMKIWMKLFSRTFAKNFPSVFLSKVSTLVGLRSQ